MDYCVRHRRGDASLASGAVVQVSARAILRWGDCLLALQGLRALLPHLRSSVDECDARTMSTFQFLDSVVKSHEMNIFRTSRNRATFHYDRLLPASCLQEIVKAEPDRPWSYLVGSEPLEWRFELAETPPTRPRRRESSSSCWPRSIDRGRGRAHTEGGRSRCCFHRTIFQ
jgi:hypothetical protein